ncbi:MAG: wax ester/triacylglycerol synthase family O-acyltransferase [Acidimicrobiia bacterium]|nr:wax ester/triacylglycerol synthase family O-acyltransferase [Acidimicrobiia bacterium]
MRQLSGLDASFLNLETPSTPLHVASVAILDGDTADFDAIRAHIEERLHLLPPFRWKLAQVPFGLDHPYWIDDPDFDIEFHVRRIALPAPGDDQQLADQVSRIHARPLDRSRPLWELYYIDNVHGRDVAILTKMHHAAVDGASGAEILTTLLDVTPVPGEFEAPPASRDVLRYPSQLEMLARGGAGVLMRPAHAWRTMRRTVQALPAIGRQVGAMLSLVQPEEKALARPKMQAPPTPFNAPITPHRRFAFGSVSLDTVKEIKSAQGTTVNDVIMAAAAGAIRRYLIDKDALPDRPLQAMVPVSVRTSDEKGTMGNRVTTIVAMLPTDLDDPLERLQRVHEVMQVAKERDAVPADLLSDFTEFAPPAVAARAARAVARLRWADRFRTPVNLVISNIPGPNVPLYYAGARLKHLYPVSAIVDGIGLNLTLQSYMGSIDFGLVSCRDLVPDLATLLAMLEDEFAILEEAAL